MASAVRSASMLRTRYGLVAAVALLAPLLVFAYLTFRPAANRLLLMPVQHFFIVSNVALLAAGVALLIARAALQIEQHKVLLIALGFMSLASLFAVHALATPGMGMVPAGADSTALPGFGEYDPTGLSPRAPGSPGAGAPGGAPPRDYSGTVIGLSAYLSLFVPSLFFAAAYSEAVSRRPRLPIPPAALIAIVAAFLLGYAALAVTAPQVLADLPLSRLDYAYLLAAVSAAAFVFAAQRQYEIFKRTRLPMHGALVIAFLLLAQAQVIMVVSVFWTLAWWEYHVLMFAAVVLALGALFVELDRRRGLERFLPAEVVERVVSGDLLRLAGERRVVTVMFADLRGSTRLAERLQAEEMVGLLNECVGGLAQCVFAHGGMLDKFLGDGLMAIFGILPDASDGAVPAAQATLSMRREIRRINAERAARGLPRMGFGVGLHTGEVILGAVGIPQRSEFTAIGDVVNTAARLQELSKEFDVDVVLSAQTAERLPGAELEVRPLGEAAVRGKAQPVAVLTLGGP